MTIVSVLVPLYGGTPLSLITIGMWNSFCSSRSNCRRLLTMPAPCPFAPPTDNRSRQQIFHLLSINVNARYTPPSPKRLNCRVESRRRCEQNSQLVHDDCRRIRYSVDNLETDQTDSIAVWLREFWSILITFFNNDVTMSSLVINLFETSSDSSTYFFLCL